MNAKCRVQNAEVKIKGYEIMARSHTAILQFAFWNLTYALLSSRTIFVAGSVFPECSTWNIRQCGQRTRLMKLLRSAPSLRRSTPNAIASHALFWQRRFTGVDLGRASLRLCSAADLSSC
jgi:hypothetical protein